MCKRLYAEPKADIVYRDGKVFQEWVPEEESEDVKYVMSVVGEGVRVNDRVKVHCEQTSRNKDSRL